MDALLIALGCVASQPEKDKHTNEKTKTNNIKILADKLKIKKADDKEQLFDKENFDDLEEAPIEESKDTSVKSDESKTVKSALDNMKTYVLVVNGNMRKRFVFKDSVRVVNGQKYKCKNGFNEQNVLIYNRALWIGQSTTEEATDRNEEVAAVMELS